jgi:hypothetical protein
MVIFRYVSLPEGILAWNTWKLRRKTNGHCPWDWGNVGKKSFWDMGNLETNHWLVVWNIM